MYADERRSIRVYLRNLRLKTNKMLDRAALEAYMFRV
jgi:hypothetical protein